MNTFENTCIVVNILLFILAIVAILIILLEKPVRYFLAFLLALVFACSSCGPPRGKLDGWAVTVPHHDTGIYYVYRAINLKTGKIQLAKIDTVWNVYQSTDTVYLDRMGFIAPTKDKIADTVRLGICLRTVTLQDDTIILSSSNIVPSDLGTAD